MAVDNYIQELLYKIEKIPIQGLGTFVTYESPARINQENQSIEPPKKSVTFKPEIEGDENYLINLVSERENSSRQQSIETVNEFVKEVKREVKHSFGYSIEGVGTFIEGNHDDLRFIPDPQANFNLETYGLADVPLPQRNVKEQHRSDLGAASYNSVLATPPVKVPPVNRFRETNNKLVEAEPVNVLKKETPSFDEIFKGDGKDKYDLEQEFATEKSGLVEEVIEPIKEPIKEPIRETFQEPLEKDFVEEKLVENRIEPKLVEPVSPVQKHTDIEKKPVEKIPERASIPEPEIAPKEKRTVDSVLEENLGREPQPQRDKEELPEPMQPEPAKNNLGWLAWFLPLALLGLIILTLFNIKQREGAMAVEDASIGNVTENQANNNQVINVEQEQVTNSAVTSSATATGSSSYVSVEDDKQESSQVNTATESQVNTATESQENINASTSGGNVAGTNPNTETATNPNASGGNVAGTNSNIETATNPINKSNSTNSEEKIKGTTAVKTQNTLPGGYYGVTNVFSEVLNAQKHVNDLNLIGYSAFVVRSQGSYRSCVFLSKSKTEAQTALQNVKQNINKDTWLMIN